MSQKKQTRGIDLKQSDRPAPKFIFVSGGAEGVCGVFSVFANSGHLPGGHVFRSFRIGGFLQASFVSKPCKSYDCVFRGVWCFGLVFCGISVAEMHEWKWKLKFQRLLQGRGLKDSTPEIQRLTSRGAVQGPDTQVASFFDLFLLKPMNKRWQSLSAEIHWASGKGAGAR